MHLKLRISEVPSMAMPDLKEEIKRHVAEGYRVSSFFGMGAKNKVIKIYAVLAHDEKGRLKIFQSRVRGQYSAFTTVCPQVHLFEREIFEQWGIIPKEHPWLKPVRFHKPYASVGNLLKKEPKIGEMNFFNFEGHEVHEVAVGPVHAGIIEPGHFRFQCHGEDVIHLEISLGYQHRGIEPWIMKNPKRVLPYMETIAGDTTIGHTTAYCENMEGLSGLRLPERAKILRIIMLELERMANHIGDLGALAGDIGFLPTAAYCGRIRGDVLNLSALICGSRFGRSMLKAGGVNFDLTEAGNHAILAKLDKVFKAVKGAVALLWENPSVLARFENSGVLSSEDVVNLGIVGPAARASGVKRDIRFSFEKIESGGYSVPMALGETGDVYARAMVRWLEIQSSINIIRENIKKLPRGNISSPLKGLEKNAIAVSLIEGFRGEICHTAISNENGDISGYKIVDPSFHNWMGLAMAMRRQQISDFPLCNKSFNLSYCGHDL